MRLTFKFLTKQLNIIGLANGYGGRHLGCEEAVKVLKNSSIFKECKVPYKWNSIIEETVTGRSVNALEGIIKNSEQLCNETSKLIKENEELLVIGGDHSSAIGTWSGVATALRPKGDIGLLWVDAHMDSHTFETSFTGNIHGMPVAHLLGFGHDKLTRIGDNFPKIKPSNLALIGIRSYEPAEEKLLTSLGVKIFYMKDIHKYGLDKCMENAIEKVSKNTIGYGMSIDIDSFRVEDAPAVGTPEDDGIVAVEFMNFIKNANLDKLLVTEIVEFMPKKDDKNKKSEKLMKKLVESVYERRFRKNIPLSYNIL
ncbi:Arginase [Strongyloides ratti]|uniref:Arginase n=1 Tax=Strongyloides ratti TaxID=34506 RepID=A0A090MTY4_STRRB|nr:Arginase [Strongyloides ratti]CEF61853.1 Arginase [Strongyloides ratti]